jgi:hypothetical protein
MKLSFLFLLLVLLAGCQESTNGVKVLTSGIVAPLLFTVENMDADNKVIDLGEHVQTDGPKGLTIRISNDSRFDYTNMGLRFSTPNGAVPALTYVPSGNGDIAFPGLGGTCGKILLSKQSCIVKILFTPRESRFYEEILTLSFNNYVTPESHTGTIKILSGLPASLSFKSGLTQYTFGQLIGAAKLPVVERADSTIYEELLEIENTGGLSAKNISSLLVERCVSSVTNDCPTGMDGAYQISGQCPTTLAPGASCSLKLTYKPKNQDPTSGPTPDEIKEILYNSTLTVSYIRDPNGNTGGLNAYFRSVSTNIQAIFKVAVTAVVFDDPIIVGNRESRTFRINNIGYREGQLQKIQVRDSANSLLAVCSAANDGRAYLDCKHPTLGTSLTLAQLPYRFKDRDGCMTIPSATKKFIDVGGGCLFEVIFQPSTTFLTDMSTEFLDFQPEVVFDARFRNQETIVTKKLFNLSARSKAAARMVLDRIQYDGNQYAFTGTGPWLSDFGKLTLQSPNYFKYKSIIITFKNIGSVEATNLSFKDGMNRAIPIGGSGAELGAYSPKYFSNVIANESTCTVVPAGATCSITGYFAPIGMPTTPQEEENMFDGLIAGLKTKRFLVSYHNASLFSDTNYEEPKDIPNQVVEAQIRATLLRKALILPILEDTRNSPNGGFGVVFAGDTSVRRVFVRNIGTGEAPYIRLMNPPVPGAPSYNSSVKVVPTPNYAALGAEYDCATLVDRDESYTVPDSATPDMRPGFYAGLPKEKSCVFSLEFKTPDTRRFLNQSICNDLPVASSTTEEAGRLFNRDLESSGGSGLWEYCTYESYVTFNNIRLEYYDGDLSDSSLPYGTRFALPAFNQGISQNSSAKIIPVAPTPWLGATVYRPTFTVPTLYPGKPGQMMPESWMYGLINTYYFIKDDPSQPSQYVQGDEARDHVPSLASFSNASSHDYVLYLGAFPQNSTIINFPVNLRNFGDGQAKVLSISRSGTGNYTPDLSPASLPTNLSASAFLNPLTFNLQTTTAGEHSMSLEVTYETGRHLGPLYFTDGSNPTNLGSVGRETRTLRVLILAEVLPTSTYPQLTMTVNDYEVEQNNGSAPTVTLGPAYSAAMTWNQGTPTTVLTYDTVKLTGTPTTEDVYAQKKVTITNSSSFPLNNLFIGYRPDLVSSTTKTVQSSFKTASSTCTSKMTLAPGASCEMLIKYQPTTVDSTDNFIMTFIYSSGTSRYLMQNVGVQLFPKSPGNLIAVGETLESINYKASPTSSATTRSSYPLFYGSVNLDVVPKPLVFKDGSGTYRKLIIANTQETKASLLLSYHKYLASHSLRGFSPGTPPPNTTIPTPGEYRTVAGEQFAIIFQNDYQDTSPRLRIEASKGCLFGDDELNAAIPAFKKGFNDATVKPCHLISTLNLNFDYLLKTVSVSSGDDMRENAAELWYYSVNRSSTASFWIHFKGSVDPDLTQTAGTFTDHEAFEDKKAAFMTPVLSTVSSGVGELVGLRVLMSTSESTLNSPYNTGITSYVDIRPFPTTAALAKFTTGLNNGNYHYFRVVGIRKDVRFAFSSRFIGLNANEYLSASLSNQSVTKLVVPPVNFYYFHNEKLLVEKVLTGGMAYDQFPAASGRCTGRTALALKTPSTVSRPFKLINKVAWDLIMTTPAATTYANYPKVSHWTSENSVTVNSVAAGLPGFVDNMGSQDLTAAKVFYVRNSANYNLPVYQVVGGVPGTNYSDYESYIDGAVGFGSSRCMVTIP